MGGGPTPSTASVSLLVNAVGPQAAHAGVADPAAPPSADQSVQGAGLLFLPEQGLEQQRIVASAAAPLPVVAQFPASGALAWRGDGFAAPPPSPNAGASTAPMDAEMLAIALATHRQLDLFDREFRRLPPDLKLMLAASFTWRWKQDPRIQEHGLFSTDMISDIFDGFADHGLTGAPTIRFIDLHPTLSHDRLEDVLERTIAGLAAALQGSGMEWRFPIESDLLQHYARLLFLESLRRLVDVEAGTRMQGLSPEESAAWMEKHGLTVKPGAEIDLYSAFAAHPGERRELKDRIEGLFRDRVAFIGRQLRGREEFKHAGDAFLRSIACELAIEALKPHNEPRPEEKPLTEAEERIHHAAGDRQPRADVARVRQAAEEQRLRAAVEYIRKVAGERHLRTAEKELLSDAEARLREIAEKQQPRATAESFLSRGVISRRAIVRFWRQNKIDVSFAEPVRVFYTSAEEAGLLKRELELIRAEFEGSRLPQELVASVADMLLLRARLENGYLRVSPENPYLIWLIVKAIDPSRETPAIGGRALPVGHLPAAAPKDPQAFLDLMKWSPELFEERDVPIRSVAP